ncbi:MAG: hypothetical protein IT307_15780 [Chloroflexi bacterium]|nr:hypothetical protein [Chloroflexota bacterium]
MKTLGCIVVRRWAFPGLVCIALTCVASAPVTAQISGRTPATAMEAAPPTAGWTVSPGIGFATVWDNNVLFDHTDGRPVGDGLNVVRPMVSVDFRGRRGELGARYDGGFVRHHDLASLNSYGQRFTLSARRHLSRRTSFYLRHNAAALPTTELVELPGVAHTRVGSRLQDLRSGVEIAVSRQTNVAAGYHFQWVDFDDTLGRFAVLTGGYSHGATLAVTRTLTTRTSLTGDYLLERASLLNGDQFDVQTVWGGVEHRLSDLLRVFAAAGVSRLGLASESRMGPALRAGLARDFRRAGFNVIYSRSFVPSFGVGGTSENEDVTARLQLPLGRRVTLQTVTAWRRNEPIQQGQLPLETIWIESGVAYSFTRWMRLEAFAAATHQTIDQPGGTLKRYQLGVQVSAGTTARIR